MNEKRYKRKFEFQKNIVSRQSEQIKTLKFQIEKLKLDIKEKDEIINSVAPLKNELSQNVAEIKKYKEQYRVLIDELRKMKEIINQEVYRGRWKIVKFLIK